MIGGVIYFTKRAGWRWQVMAYRADPSGGGKEWPATSLKFWRHSTAFYLARALETAFATGLNAKTTNSVRELVHVVHPVEGDSNDCRGIPVYFWRTGDRSFSVYPIPDESVRLRCFAERKH